MGVHGTLLRDAATRYVLMPQIAALIFGFCAGPPLVARGCVSRKRTKKADHLPFPLLSPVA